MKRLLAVAMMLGMFGYILAQTPGTARHSKVFLGLGTDADVCITIDLASADKTICWDQSETEIAISDDVRVVGPDLTLGQNVDEDLTLNFDVLNGTVWLRWDESENRLAVSQDFYNANIIRSDQAFRSSQSTATNKIFQTQVSGDGGAWRRFVIEADGTMEWGNGTDDPGDTNLYRVSTGNKLRTDDDFSVRGTEISLGDNTAQDLCIRFDVDEMEANDPVICWDEDETPGQFEIDGVAISTIAGPGSSTDDAVVRWNGAGGDTIQNSTVTIDDDGDITLGDGTADDVVATFNGSSFDGTLTYDESAGNFILTPGGSASGMLFVSDLPQMQFRDTESGDAFLSGAFTSDYVADAGFGTATALYSINNRWDTSSVSLVGLSFTETASGVRKPVVEWEANAVNPVMTETYTGTTANDGHWKYDTLADKFQWTKDHYISEAGGAIILKDSGGTCYAFSVSTEGAFSEKFWAFQSRSGSSADIYAGGYYDMPAAQNNFVVPALTTNNAWGAHYAIIIGTTVSDDLQFTISGASITDAGSRTGSDSEILDFAPEGGTHDGGDGATTLEDTGASFPVDEYIGDELYNVTDGSQCTITDNDETTITCTLAGPGENDWDDGETYLVGYVADTYLETTKKWIGSTTVSHTSGTAQLVNYGYAKYWDNNNTDFTVKGLEVLALVASNATDTDVELIHHNHEGWTFGGASGPTFPTPIASMQSDYGASDEVIAGENMAYKRTNLDTDVSGSTDEGILFIIEQSANNTFRHGTASIRIATFGLGWTEVTCDD